LGPIQIARGLIFLGDADGLIPQLVAVAGASLGAAGSQEQQGRQQQEQEVEAAVASFWVGEGGRLDRCGRI
ncbi:hypothetical protein RY27_18920, partial [Litorilinea aerophila]